MKNKLKKIAKESKSVIIAYNIYQNRRIRNQLKSGIYETFSGVVHDKINLSDSISYINNVFEDYLKYSGLSINCFKGKRILEIGPGDSFGVALKFLARGVKQVVCLDKFYSKRDIEKQRKIYLKMRENLEENEKKLFDEAINLNEDLKINSDKLQYIYGKGIEEAAELFSSGYFDFIISRAVLEHLADPEMAFNVMDNLLISGGYIIHKTDLRDHGMFSNNKMHPLTFLTISNYIYRLMTIDSGKPNRKLINYYQNKMNNLKYETKILITHLVGHDTEIIPPRDINELDINSSKIHSLISKIRPKLSKDFRNLSDNDLMVAGIFLIGIKPI